MKYCSKPVGGRWKDKCMEVEQTGIHSWFEWEGRAGVMHEVSAAVTSNASGVRETSGLCLTLEKLGDFWASFFLICIIDILIVPTRIALLKGLNEQIHVKCLEKYLVCSK